MSSGTGHGRERLGEGTGTTRLRLRLERWALVGLFLLAFLPRATYPVSRPLQWYFRSGEFFRAVLRGNWAGTLFSEHPGVTVMWLSGAAAWGWYGLQSLLGLEPPTPLQWQGRAFSDGVAVGLLPLALLVALGILWGWRLVRRLFGRRVAWVAAILWALDPFYLANSKVVHLDATNATLMFLSALWMLVYLRETRLRQLAMSAVLGGLALLTKVSAIFLVPFLGLCLMVNWLLSLRGQPFTVSSLLRIGRDLILWVLVAGAVYYLLWPSMWVQPLASLDKVIREGIITKVGRGLPAPRFYRGVLTVGDPGVGFYLDVMALRLTFATSALWIVGLAACLARRKERLSAVLLCGFAVFYLLQMALASRKEERYILPAILVFDLLAACGIIWWTERVAKRVPVGSALLAGVLLVGQAAAVLPRHPYYGTHYNALLGGARAARRILPLGYFAEGLDLAGRYVDQTPGGEDAVIGAQLLGKELVTQFVRGPVHDVRWIGEGVDYLIFGVQYVMRGPYEAYWSTLWDDVYKFREAEYVVSFDGIPYAWVYRPGSAPIVPQEANARLGEQVRLAGYRLAERRVVPGDPLLLTLYWQARGPMEGDYTVFVHLSGPDGGLVAQQDNPPARGLRPTSGWEEGELLEDPYELVLPPDAPFGEYTLSVGMYDRATMERLPAFGTDGGGLAEDQVVLATVEIRPLIPWWRWALSGAWLTLILVGIVLPWVGRRA